MRTSGSTQPTLVAIVLCLVTALTPSLGSQAETLALVGGAVIDTDDWGHSERDIENAVVLIDGDQITAVGSRESLSILAAARVLDATGRFIVPGLVDGFAAINNQSYANAYLYSGVT